MKQEQNSFNNFKIRPEKPQDYLAISQVNNLAFKQQNEAKLVAKIRHSDRYIPQLSLVAELNHKIIGYIMFSYVDLVTKEITKIIALAPVAVLPEYQNKGIGSLLVKTGLEKATKISSSIVIVLGNPQFYTRFGFKPAVNFGIESAFDVPNKYFMVKFLSEKVRNYQGKIIYPAAFNNVWLRKSYYFYTIYLDN
jgi:predicted N-acetyltransferase YhbS